jgi:hypothetical protein
LGGAENQDGVGLIHRAGLVGMGGSPDRDGAAHDGRKDERDEEKEDSQARSPRPSHVSQAYQR